MDGILKSLCLIKIYKSIHKVLDNIGIIYYNQWYTDGDKVNILLI